MNYSHVLLRGNYTGGGQNSLKRPVVLSSASLVKYPLCGPIAQLVERYTGSVEVSGSNPLRSNQYQVQLLSGPILASLYSAIMSDNRCFNCGQATTLAEHTYGPDISYCPLCAGYQYSGKVENIADLYTERYYKGDEYVNYELSTHIYKRNFVRKLSALLSKSPELAPAQMRVLELGSATGDFLQVLHEGGITQTLGVEVSEYSRVTASQRGFCVIDPFAANYMQQVRDFAPNVLCAWDVWEHIERPAQIFRELIEANPSLCVIALTTVDSGALVPRLRGAAWRQFHPPTHLAYPTRKSFQRYFPSVSFNQVSIDSFGYYRPLADYISAFLPAHLMAKATWTFRLPLYLNLYDIQLVVAKRG